MERFEIETMEEPQINENGFIPLPQLLKDTFLLGGFIALTILAIVSYMDRWRRSILDQDRMTIEFQRLRVRGNELAEREE